MHWIALQPEPVPADGADSLTDPVTALGWWALRYTPKVARTGDVLLLEVAASARLWGGLPALLQHILTSNQPADLYKYAQAATSLIALAALEVRPSSALQPVKPMLGKRLPETRPLATGLPAHNPPLNSQSANDLAGIHPSVDKLTPDDLPLHALAAAQPHLDTLARLGVTTWGQLRALPRGGVSRRFGAALLDALDQAYGERPDLYPWLTLPEVFEASLELSAQVESAPALLFAARRLLAQLKVWLQLRHRGVLALELRWQMDERRHTDHQGTLLLRTAQPTQDSSHLQRLLGEHLAHVSLPAPAHTLRLRTLETAALSHDSASLLPDAVSTGDSLAQMVERLSARLGPEQVLQLQPRLDHRPEQMQTWQKAATQLIAAHAYETRATSQKCLKIPNTSVVTAGCGLGSADATQSQAAPVPVSTPASAWVSGGGSWAQPLAPTWLLQAPLKLALRQQQPQYRGPLTLLTGPQRIESGWWGGGDLALRDYFVARSAQAELLWIYRERLPDAQAASAWYLHGIFA
ncbi:MAG: DNA polymerase Y family protein [Rhodoferax sp.]|uniref:Y-family DNA polymerase n=1 Tax=Rhodoferax sp. TaxID=50421 RepID=UPI0026081033|nr:DNA polymerase Y family protein [Rhodoferax sp.]MDD2880726.1 DNA polymerase Y family protein [Rhodoferax sp.]